MAIFRYRMRYAIYINPYVIAMNMREDRKQILKNEINKSELLYRYNNMVNRHYTSDRDMINVIGYNKSEMEHFKFMDMNFGCREFHYLKNLH